MRITRQQVEKICEQLNEDLIKFFFLAKGNHNDNYFMETNHRKYVLRIESNPQFKNLKKEYKLLKSLKPELGPKVYFFDNCRKIISTDYFVEEFVEGKHPAKPDVKFIVLMAKWLKKLHGQKKKCKKSSLLSAIKPYYRNFNNHRTALSNKTANDIDSLFSRVLAFCKRNNALFGNRTTNSLLHRDLSKGNIIYDGKRIRLLDWEFSNYGFPEWDIVYFIESQKLDGKLKSIFLKTYGYSNSQFGKKKLMIISLLNTCGNIGYSVWRLGLVKEGKLNKTQEPAIFRRLKQDIKIMKKLIGGLEQ